MSQTRSLAARIALETLIATTASSLALCVAAKVQNKGVLQPFNATSHWLNGEDVADRTAFGWRTTGVGLITHIAATGFWAAIYEGWLSRGKASAVNVVGKGIAMSGISALVDYRATPKQFTPGWEFILTPGAMAVAYLALGAGLAASNIRR